MPEMKPHVIVIAGPNGAGKSTTAPVLLKGTLGVTEFVNADDNSARSGPRLVADGGAHASERVYDPKTWSLIRGEMV